MGDIVDLLKQESLLKFSRLKNENMTFEKLRLNFLEKCKSNLMMKNLNSSQIDSIKSNASDVISHLEFENFKSSSDVNCKGSINISKFNSFSEMPSEYIELIKKFDIDEPLGNFSLAYSAEIIVAHPDNLIGSKINDADSQLNTEINLKFKETNSAISLLVVLPKESYSNVFINVTSDEKVASAALVNVFFLCEENAKSRIIFIQNTCENFKIFETRKCILNRNSNISFIDIRIGGINDNSIQDILLNGESANCSLKMLYSAKGKMKYEFLTRAHHNERNTKSDLLARGAVSDDSIAYANGLINIGKNAYGSQGYEKQEALMLDKKSRVFAMPELVINNNDVKCSHGSSVGRIDADKIYYLMSKGLSENHAKELIIKGYFSSFFEDFSDAEIKKLISISDFFKNIKEMM